MNYNLFHNNSCLGDVYSFQLRIPVKIHLSNTSMIKQLSLTIRLSLVCCSLRHMVVNTVRLAASQFSKINRPIFSNFKLYEAVKLRGL